MKKVTFELVGLDCANCASKIERKINQSRLVEEVSLNFMTKCVSLKYDNEATKAQLQYEIQKIVNQIEKGITVREYIQQAKIVSEETVRKNKILRISISLILFALSLIIKNELVILTAILFCYFISGYDVILSAVKSVVNKKPFDESFLMTIATVGAFVIGENVEAAAVMLFYQIGEFFQEYAVKRSRRSIAELMDIRPDYANLKTNNGSKKVNPSELVKGDIILIRPGERIPVDIKVISGESSVDTSSLTGESVPRHVSNGDELLSGSINMSSPLEAEVMTIYAESTVARILDLVENAGNKKAVSERFITRFSRIYTPSVVVMSLLIALIPPLFIDISSLSQWVYRGLIFLVVSCPCALVLSVPLSFFGGIGGATRSGVLIKGSSAIEVLEKVQFIAFDKTGTLTTGKFKVAAVNAVNVSEKELFEYAALAESISNHPVAQSVVKAYDGELDSSRVTNAIEISGRGISADIDGKEILVGNARLMRNNSIVSPLVQTGGTVIHVAVSGKYWGYIEVVDEIKENLTEMISELKSLDVTKVVMFTGDRKQSAEYTSRKIGMDDVYFEMLPIDKVNNLESMINSVEPGKKVAFVGDGINDAPVLARADVGIAMGGVGSDSAIEAADVVIMSDDPSKICAALRISKNTMKIVRQNIVFALSVKALVLIMAIFGMTSMWVAVFADVGVSLIAVFNSLRTLKKIS